MSWLFVLSKPERNQDSAGGEVHDPPRHTVRLPGLYVAAGGIPETLFFEHDPDSGAGWVVAGTGLQLGVNGTRILNAADWRNQLRGRRFDPGTLDGHFVVLRWNRDRVECYTDQLGLRSLYFADCRKGICLSTRLDWVAHSCEKREIDFAGLGSRWLMINEMWYDSGIQGITRLGPNGRAVIEAGSIVSCRSEPWSPSFRVDTADRSIDTLHSIIQGAISQPYTLSLGLSGGLDSRLLLALLSPYGKDKYMTHTFGHPQDPDVRMAGRITASQQIRHRHFNDPVPDATECLSLMYSFAAQTHLSEAVSAINKVRYYTVLRNQKILLIDGGFGEIARRQYMNRLVRLGRSAVRSRDCPRLLKLMKYPHADFFSREVADRMYDGAMERLEQTLKNMPEADQIGIANFADLLAIRTRVPNWRGPEQARLDGEILSFNPLVQPSFLRSVLRAPVKVRADGKFYYDLIRKLNPGLARFALVKSGGTYPFGMSGSAAWLWSKIKGKIRPGFADPGPAQLLGQLKTYVLDLAGSHPVRSNPVYDTPKIREQVGKYYKGDVRQLKFVDWWLTYELWQKGITVPIKPSARSTL